MASQNPNVIDATDERIVAEGYEEVKGVSSYLPCEDSFWYFVLR
jgi:hypothetical protein